jgi:phosphopantothenoylcysteine decarboxylase/phosphopantothenate--cysteine ligase
MSYLSGRRIVVGVGGDVAAYRAAELVCTLRRLQAEVRVILTESAEQFVSPQTLQALSQHPVACALWSLDHEQPTDHMEMARWADAVVVAPATEKLTARLATGVGDDLLTSVALATQAPIVMCPSINVQTSLRSATQDTLRSPCEQSRMTVLPLENGEWAGAESSVSDIDRIVQYLGRVLGSGILRGRRVVVTAGPTREAFDPVRFLSNRSSGKMGYALASEAWRAGADVLLISGPVTLTPPFGVRLQQVTTAAQMRQAVFESIDDILIMAAAVADYTPRDALDHKRKKTDGDWNPTLGRTADILGDLSRHCVRPRLTIGFAAETDAVAEYAADKLRRKSLDGIVGNSVAGPGGAFESDHNTVIMLTHGREPHHAGPATKREIAESIVQWISTLSSGVSHG